MGYDADNDVVLTAARTCAPMIDLNGARILVTGGTGSFGQALIAKILATSTPERVIVFSRDELKQYQMAQRFPAAEHACLRYVIGDVRDADRLAMVMTGVDVVVHAAALKQVPTAEYNPFECVKTNILGTQNVVQAAIQARVSRVVTLSTDKAVNPVNLYGATKLVGDKITIAANHMGSETGTRLSVLRYGNVLNSRGSVVPMFRQLAQEGATALPITHADMTRFWITLPQAVDFTLSSLELMRGGEIFVPKIPSMRIVDLAEAIAPGVPQTVIGIRPGEKLHETLISGDDARDTIDFGAYYVIEPSFAMWQRESFRDTGGSPVSDDFRYTSDSNDQWVGAAELSELLRAESGEPARDGD